MRTNLLSTNVQLISRQVKRLGKTSLQMPLLGFGAAPVGNLYQAMSDAQAQLTIAEALSQGIRYFDTAPHYGFGLSEARLGMAFSEMNPDRRDELIISSKVGRVLIPTKSTETVRHGFVDAPAFEPVFDYSYDAVMRSFDASLQRLKINYIDILLAHDLGSATHGAEHPARFKEFMDGGFKAMNELRAAGVVSAIGVGANEWQVCEQALAHGDFDCFLLAGRYTLLEQGACDSFLPLCAQRKVSVLLGGPFNSGILASGVQGNTPLYYNYEPAPSDIIARVKKLESICSEFDVSLPAAALQFPAAHPQICSVIAGLATPTQVNQAVAWMNQEIPAAFWQALRAQELINSAAPLPIRSAPVATHSSYS